MNLVPPPSPTDAELTDLIDSLVLLIKTDRRGRRYSVAVTLLQEAKHWLQHPEDE